MSRRIAAMLFVLISVVGCGRLGYGGGSQAGGDAAPRDGTTNGDGRIADGSSDRPPLDGSAIDGSAIDGAAIDSSAIDGSPIDSSAIDGSPIDSSAIDGSFPLPTSPFSPPRLISALSSPTEDEDPSVTGDLLELYFESSRNRPNRVYVSQRATPSDPWGPPAIVTEFEDIAVTNPHVSSDGLALYLTPLTWGPVGRQDLYVSTRATRTSPWSEPAVVASLSSPEHDSGGSESTTGRLFVLDSERAGGTGLGDIWLSRREAAGDWSAPDPLDVLNEVSDESNPALAAADLLIVFDSDRSGGDDLYFATRTSPDASFEAPRPLTELNSSARDSAPSLSPDGRYIVFMSTRDGNPELYEASR